jgi:transposase
VRRAFVFLKRLFADGGYSGDETWAAAKRAGKVDLEIVKRCDAAEGCVVLLKRWLVERTFGWPLSSPRKGFRKSHAHPARLRQTRHNTAYGAQNRKTLNCNMKLPDRLL